MFTQKWMLAINDLFDINTDPMVLPSNYINFVNLCFLFLLFAEPLNILLYGMFLVSLFKGFTDPLINILGNKGNYYRIWVKYDRKFVENFAIYLRDYWPISTWHYTHWQMNWIWSFTSQTYCSIWHL